MKEENSSINREELLKVINAVKPAISAQSYIPILTHLAFNTEEVIAYNDIAAISIKHETDLNLCLPGELLIKGLNSFSGDGVIIQKSDKEEAVVVSSGRSKLKVPFLSFDDFPFEFPKTKLLGTINLGDSTLEGIEKCLISVGGDPHHPAQMGITLDCVESLAVLFSTDNNTISQFQTEDEIDLPADTPLILPTFFCNQLIALGKLFTDDPVKLEIRNGSLTAKFGDKAKLFTKMVVDVEPMDFIKIIDKYCSINEIKKAALEIPNSFEASFNRAMLVLGSEVDKSTQVTQKDGKLKLFTKTTIGEVRDSMSFETEDSEEFFIDPQLVLRASKIANKMAALERVLVFTNTNFSFIHLISHCAS